MSAVVLGVLPGERSVGLRRLRLTGISKGEPVNEAAG